MIYQIWERIVYWWNSPDLYYSLVDNRFFLIVLVIFVKGYFDTFSKLF